MKPETWWDRHVAILRIWECLCLAAFLAAVLYPVGCARPTIGPFVPASAPRCDSDVACKDGYVCRFPHAGSHAVCVRSSDDPDYLAGPTENP